MKRFLTILFLLIVLVSFGQPKNIQVPVYRQKDTTLWYIWTRENIQKIGLEDLTTTTVLLHFRFWTERQAVDIWTTDNKVFQGKLISYTEEYNPDKYKADKPKPEKFYSKTDNIDTTLARQIFEFANYQQLFKVPFQDSIKGWSNGLDGDTYLVEYSTPSNYSFKDYWTPEIQRNIKEAEIISATNKYLQNKLSMNEKWIAFINSLPKGCYHAGGLLLTCNNTKKKNRS